MRISYREFWEAETNCDHLAIAKFTQPYPLLTSVSEVLCRGRFAARAGTGTTGHAAPVPAGVASATHPSSPSAPRQPVVDMPRGDGSELFYSPWGIIPKSAMVTEENWGSVLLEIHSRRGSKVQDLGSIRGGFTRVTFRGVSIDGVACVAA